MLAFELSLVLAVCLMTALYCAARNNFGALFIPLLFGEYVAIQGKLYFGYQYLGVYKELSVAAILVMLLFYGTTKMGDKLLIVAGILTSAVALAITAELRPFVGLLLAALAGRTIAHHRFDLRPNILLLCIFSLLICGYQYANVTEFSDLWFFDFLHEKAGQEFLATSHAYFRNDRVRPPGFLISPSVFGLLFIVFSYFGEKIHTDTIRRILVKLICFGGLVMIQTRALLIIFVAYEIQRSMFPVMSPRNVTLYYLATLLITLIGTMVWGDEGALVRILLFASLISDLSSGMGWLPLTAAYDGPVDSQMVAFIRLFGMLGFFWLIYAYRAVYHQSKRMTQYQTKELSFFCVLFFVNVFQWSDSSPGNLIGWFAISYYYYQRKFSSVSIPRRQLNAFSQTATA